jgi:hypothetical protein
MTMKTVPISSLLNGPQNHLGADRPMHRMTYTSWTPKPDSGQLMGCNPSVPHSVPRRPRTDQAGSGGKRLGRLLISTFVNSLRRLEAGALDLCIIVRLSTLLVL